MVWVVASVRYDYSKFILAILQNLSLGLFKSKSSVTLFAQLFHVLDGLFDVCVIKSSGRRLVCLRLDSV